MEPRGKRELEQLAVVLRAGEGSGRVGGGWSACTSSPEKMQWRRWRRRRPPLASNPSLGRGEGRRRAPPRLPSAAAKTQDPPAQGHECRWVPSPGLVAPVGVVAQAQALAPPPREGRRRGGGCRGGPKIPPSHETLQEPPPGLLPRCWFSLRLASRSWPLPPRLSGPNAMRRRASGCGCGCGGAPARGGERAGVEWGRDVTVSGGSDARKREESRNCASRRDQPQFAASIPASAEGPTVTLPSAICRYSNG